MSGLKETYNRIAADWNADHEGDTWWQTGTDKFLSYLQKGDLILDVGCAGGIKTKYFIDHGFRAVGIDLSEKMVELAKLRLPSEQFFVKDITEQLTLDYKFDGIFAQAVLLHVPKAKIKRVIDNLLGLLNKGGYFYIAVKSIKEGGSEEDVVKENDYGYEYERFFSFYTLSEIEGYLKEFNMEIVFSDVSAIGSTNWIQVIAKKL